MAYEREKHLRWDDADLQAPDDIGEHRGVFVWHLFGRKIRPHLDT